MKLELGKKNKKHIPIERGKENKERLKIHMEKCIDKVYFVLIVFSWLKMLLYFKNQVSLLGCKIF